MADRFDRVARDLLPCDHEDDECTCGEYQASISTALREAFDEGRCERRRAYIAGVIAADEAEDRARELRRALDTTERPDIRTAMLMRALRAEYERGRAEERAEASAACDRAHAWYHHEAIDTKDEAAAVHWFSIGQRCAAEEIGAAIRQSKETPKT